MSYLMGSTRLEWCVAMVVQSILALQLEGFTPAISACRQCYSLPEFKNNDIGDAA